MASETVVVMGIIGLIPVLIGASLIFNRFLKQRVERAKTAEILRIPLTGPVLNRRMLLWAAMLVVFAFAMGALSGKKGPISSSNPWAAAATGGGLLVLFTGVVASGMRRVGGITLERANNTLTIQVADSKRVFELNEDFENGEMTLLPRPLAPNGGTVIVLRQTGQ